VCGREIEKEGSEQGIELTKERKTKKRIINLKKLNDNYSAWNVFKSSDNWVLGINYYL